MDHPSESFSSTDVLPLKDYIVLNHPHKPSNELSYEDHIRDHAKYGFFEDIPESEIPEETLKLIKKFKKKN